MPMSSGFRFAGGFAAGVGTAASSAVVLSAAPLDPSPPAPPPVEVPRRLLRSRIAGIARQTSQLPCSLIKWCLSTNMCRNHRESACFRVCGYKSSTILMQGTVRTNSASDELGHGVVLSTQSPALNCDARRLCPLGKNPALLQELQVIQR